MPVRSTCDLCDAHKADTSGDFRVLPPVFRAFGAVAAFVQINPCVAHARP